MLRPYQENAANEVLEAWGHTRNVLMVMPTGGGKTHTKTHIMKTFNQPACAIAHRQELILQISDSLATFGIFHNIIAPASIVAFCAKRHAFKHGRVFYDRNAPVAVSGVRTLLRRANEYGQFLQNVRLWDIDEAHHVLPDNQWGQAVSLFPNAYGLGVTATPLRCDRQGLDGIFSHMVQGPTMRDLIDMGYLTDYRIFCPPVAIDLARVRVSQSSGEFVKKDLVEETHKSKITGDVVQHYLKFAAGKRGLTFAVDVKSATDIADAYNASGVPAAVVTAKTPDNIRTELLDRLARGEVKQLVNVDLFGEGMDCPALEVVSMARPTQSYGLYVQQFGRSLRILDGKDKAVIIDHVGNVVRHGLPDAPRDWSLAAPERRKAGEPNTIKLTTCTACFQPYERHRAACPWCGARPIPDNRSAPEFVDGDLAELDPEILARMRADVKRIDGPPRVPQNADPVTVKRIENIWIARQRAQHELRQTMELWAGIWHHGHDETDSEIQKRFYLTFDIDIPSARALGAKDAEKLQLKIQHSMT